MARTVTRRSRHAALLADVDPELHEPLRRYAAAVLAADEARRALSLAANGTRMYELERLAWLLRRGWGTVNDSVD